MDRRDGQADGDSYGRTERNGRIARGTDGRMDDIRYFCVSSS